MLSEDVFYTTGEKHNRPDLYGSPELSEGRLLKIINELIFS